MSALHRRAIELGSGQRCLAAAHASKSHLPDVRRGGLLTKVIRASDAAEDLNSMIDRFIVANYTASGYTSGVWLANHGVLPPPHPDRLHLIAIDLTTGLISAYLTFKDPVHRCAKDGETMMASSHRKLFPVEQLFGAEIFIDLPEFDRLRVRNVREIGRFQTNRIDGLPRAVLVRSAMEIKCAFCRVCEQVLVDHDIRMLVGDSQPQGAVASFDLLHFPYTMVTGSRPSCTIDDFLQPYFETCDVRPFAVMPHDVTKAREQFHLIDAALAKELPLRGLLSLRAMRRYSGSEHFRGT